MIIQYYSCYIPVLQTVIFGENLSQVIQLQGMLNVFKIFQKSVYLNLGTVAHVKDNDFNLAFEIVEKGFT